MNFFVCLWMAMLLKGSSYPLRLYKAFGSTRIVLRSLSGSSGNVEISPTDHNTQPIARFDECALHEKLRKQLATMNLIEPTPIQAHTIPLLLEDNDVMASAATGSGKTLMFGLPLLHHRMVSDTKTLIINPTRELAAQTAQVLTDVAKCDSSLFVNLAVGGEDVKFQRNQLKRINGTSILVGTPGRILQFVDERVLYLRQFQYVVVDEADRCLDLGFEPQLRRIARSLDPRRQTILCSATFPESVQRIASEFLRPEYYFVAAGRVGGMNPNVAQQLTYCRTEHRLPRVLELVETTHAGKRIIIFCNTKDACEKLKAELPEAHIITGDKSQDDRNAAVAAFRDEPGAVLIATDVASRGLDVSDVGLVIQVDAPRDVDSFVHRSGRTGRAGNSGMCITFLDSRNQNIAKDLVELLHEVGQDVPAWLYGMAYTDTARRLEEEAGLIALKKEQGADMEGVGDGHAQFTDQDFRKTAGKDSWGSARSTSYESFDQDAYGDDTLVNQTKMDANKDTFKAMDLSQADNIVNIPHKRPVPSHELLQILKQRNLSLDAHPNKSVFHQLVSRPDPCLRYEYLGLFDFSTAKTLLARPKSNEKAEDPNTRRVLMVAEKPSIAKAVADALSGNRAPRQKRGISKALPVYEFYAECQLPSGSPPLRSLITVTSVVGHVFSLGFQDNSAPGTKRQNVDPEEFFETPVVKQEESTTGKLRVIEHLQALAAASDHLVLWLDCDAEGENIAHEVIGVTRQAMAMNLNGKESFTASSDQTIHRAFFSAITNKAIQEAFRKLGEPNEALSRSVDARQELDLRVGVALTRLLSWRCAGLARKKFSPATKLISYGPCQTPTLSFCIDRANEIKAFKKKAFYKVSTTAKTAKGTVTHLDWVSSTRVENNSKRGLVQEKGATYSRETAEEILNACRQPGATVKVTRIEEIPESIRAPTGLNTVSLLSTASKSMGMSPKQVMNVAEKLYSSGFISYPRTETTRYDPNGFDVQKMLQEHARHPDWGKTAAFLLQSNYRENTAPPQRGKDKGDHPPIYCLKPATKNEVGGGTAWRVFDFICRSFIGSLGDDLLFTRRRIHFELESPTLAEPPQFQVEQVVVDKIGFASACSWVLRDINAERKDEESIVFREGMSLPVNSCRMDESFTRPPPFLQEHELIEKMDVNRIGTDASMASHVSNIVDRAYVVVCDETGQPLRPPRRPEHSKRLPRQIGRYFVPTPLGIQLVDLFERSDATAELSRPSIRAQMEAEVNQIAQSQLDKDTCVQRNLDWFRERYIELDESLTRKTLDKFSRRLTTTKKSLENWQRMGAFEAPTVTKPRDDARKNEGGRDQRSNMQSKPYRGNSQRKTGNYQGKPQRKTGNYQMKQRTQ